MDQHPDANYIYLEPDFPHFDTCCVCNCDVQMYVWQPTYAIPMYEGVAVPVEWDGEWGGFSACSECFFKYERGELPMWDLEDLKYMEYLTGNQKLEQL